MRAIKPTVFLVLLFTSTAVFAQTDSPSLIKQERYFGKFSVQVAGSGLRFIGEKQPGVEHSKTGYGGHILTAWNITDNQSLGAKMVFSYHNEPNSSENFSLLANYQFTCFGGPNNMPTRDMDVVGLYAGLGIGVSNTTTQNDSVKQNTSRTVEKTSIRRVNFYVVNKPKTVDLFSRLVVLRAREKAMTRRHKFIVIVATSAREAKDKIEDHLQTKNAMIGSLWFDTHGRYANGYSSFILGKDEFSYKTVKDTAKMKDFRALASFCDEYTRVAIGSCYGGATFEKPAHNGKPATRMNGDSLMIGLANLLPTATIYGTEGWVMTKPGIFSKHSYALAGYPLQKRFKDEVYKPVWEHMGIWHSYSTITERFEKVNTLSLTHMGSIHIKEVTYLDREKSKQRLEKNLARLKPGLSKT